MEVFHYHFTIDYTSLDDGSQEFFDVKMCDHQWCAEIPWLHLSSSIKEVKELIAILEAVIKGERTEHYWGSDVKHIHSKQETSTVRNPNSNDATEMPTEVQTVILLKMVKDWVLFLESIPKELLGTRTNNSLLWK